MRELEALRRRYGGHQPGLLGARHSYAVLCPLVERPDGLHLLFEVRARNLSQGGEVCFPGGRMEAGETPAQCALRETEEELGLGASFVELGPALGRERHVSGFWTEPVLARLNSGWRKAIHPSPAEVQEVFTVPLDFFRRTPPEVYRCAVVTVPPEDFPSAALGFPEGYSWREGACEVPVWFWENRPIWGLTARIVRRLAGRL